MRQNPHVRICGGAGSATTLVYPTAFHPQVFARTYRGRRSDGFDYLEAEGAEKDPSFGYSVLAQVLASTKHKVVVTTNYDNLV